MNKIFCIVSLMLILLFVTNAVCEDRLLFYQQETPDKDNGQKMQYLYDQSCFWGEEWIIQRKGKTLPVYAYPSEDGWRGANGKACVATSSGFTALAWSEDEEWLLIDYEISSGHRVGYIKAPEGMNAAVPTLYPLHIPMQLARDTFLTDDPNGTQKQIARLPAGFVVDVLGYTDGHWAYVEVEIGGQKARAFMEIMNLAMPEETENAQVAAQLVGTWRFIGGAELLGYGAIFDGNGSVQICDTEDLGDESIDSLIVYADSVPLTYRVYENALGEKRYPGCAYILEIERADSFSRYGLQVATTEGGNDTFSLIIAEAGGGGYERAENIEIIRK